MKNSHSESYAAAGVDVTAGYEAVERIKPMVESTYIPGVMGTLGGFGGMFAPDLAGMKKPVLVSGTDGVGTKLKLAFLMDKHDTVGIDCVAMCVNDIVCGGAAPMFFLDYIACGKNHPARIADIVSGITEGCRQAECALVGGETAEMPGFYPEDEYDLAGFTVGVVDKSRISDRERVQSGDVILGLSSSGVHSNGFSLVRKVFDLTSKEAVERFYPELGSTLGECLLAPTKIYVKPMLELMRQVPVKSVSHITGGGFYENIPRALNDRVTARIDKASVPVLPIFRLLQKTGGISEHDMFNTFNMGVGMCVIVAPEDADRAMEILRSQGEQVTVIGEVVPRGESEIEIC